MLQQELSDPRASLVAQRIKRLLVMRETQVWSLGQKDPLEKEMATHSSILAWRIPWMEEPGRLQSTWSRSWTRLSNFTRDTKTYTTVISVPFSRVGLFVTPWTAGHQASITNSQSLLKLMSIKSVMPSNHLILCHPLSSPSPPAFNLAQHRGLFQWVSSPHQVTRVYQFQLQLQHQPFQWLFSVDFL